MFKRFGVGNTIVLILTFCLFVQILLGFAFIKYNEYLSQQPQIFKYDRARTQLIEVEWCTQPGFFGDHSKLDFKPDNTFKQQYFTDIPTNPSLGNWKLTDRQNELRIIYGEQKETTVTFYKDNSVSIFNFRWYNCKTVLSRRSNTSEQIYSVILFWLFLFCFVYWIWQLIKKVLKLR